MKDQFILARTRFYNERLVQARKDYGIVSIKLAARAIGITEASLGNYERMSAYPNLEIAERIANFYNKDVGWLFEETYKKISKAKRNFGKPYLEQSMSQAEYISLESKEVKLLVDSNISPAIDKINKDDMKKEISDSLSTLNERERAVVEMYFGINREYALTLREIGEEFHITMERARQIKEKAILRLRHKSRSKGLEVFTEIVSKKSVEKVETPRSKEIRAALKMIREEEAEEKIEKRENEKRARIRCDICHSDRPKESIAYYHGPGTDPVKWGDQIIVHCSDTGICEEGAKSMFSTLKSRINN